MAVSQTDYHRYFSASKWSSFSRQLCLYRFSRVAHGMDRGGYYHEYFLRGRPDFTSMIIRIPTSLSGDTKASRGGQPQPSKTVPNFTAFPICRETIPLNHFKDEECLETTILQPMQSHLPVQPLKPLEMEWKPLLLRSDEGQTDLMMRSAEEDTDPIRSFRLDGCTVSVLAAFDPSLSHPKKPTRPIGRLR